MPSLWCSMPALRSCRVSLSIITMSSLFANTDCKQQMRSCHLHLLLSLRARLQLLALLRLLLLFAAALLKHCCHGTHHCCTCWLKSGPPRSALRRASPALLWWLLATFVDGLASSTSMVCCLYGSVKPFATTSCACSTRGSLRASFVSSSSSKTHSSRVALLLLHAPSWTFTFLSYSLCSSRTSAPLTCLFRSS